MHIVFHKRIGLARGRLTAERITRFVGSFSFDRLYLHLRSSFHAKTSTNDHLLILSVGGVGCRKCEIAIRVNQKTAKLVVLINYEQIPTLIGLWKKNYVHIPFLCSLLAWIASANDKVRTDK